MPADRPGPPGFLATPLPRRVGPVVGWTLAAAFAAMFFVAGYDNSGRARVASRAKSCAANLRVIANAGERIAKDRGLPPGMPVPLDALVAAGDLESVPVCPEGGEYQNVAVGAMPTCSFDRPSLPSRHDYESHYGPRR
jgi:hypothetical protein